VLSLDGGVKIVRGIARGKSVRRIAACLARVLDDQPGARHGGLSAFRGLDPNVST